MKVVFISGMLPQGHYSQYITSGLVQMEDIELIVYASRDKNNLKIDGCGKIVPIWSKSAKYILEILSQIRKDNPDVVHLQHEINMYGGIITAIIYPLLVLALRAKGIKVITTIHASVYKKQINDDFIKLFHKKSVFVRPFILRLFFHYLYTSISIFSNRIIVHTNLAKDILTKDYNVNTSKIVVIPIAIPQKEVNNNKKGNYFLYFGYMVRRKGLDCVIKGFSKFKKNNPKTKYKLILAGGVIKGQEKALKEIKDSIRKNQLEKDVEIKGFVKRESELDDLYQKAYAVVIPAIVSMGSSGPLFHANSYGKCAIASKIGHFMEDILDGKTGLLTENDKWDRTFEYAISNPELVAKIEKNVAKKARLRSPKSTAKIYINIYEKK